MIRNFTLEYWKDKSWYVGKLKEVPGVFSQGKTLAELESNIQEVYQLEKYYDADFGLELRDEVSARLSSKKRVKKLLATEFWSNVSIKKLL